jgi:hypothetical protein
MKLTTLVVVLTLVAPASAASAPRWTVSHATVPAREALQRDGQYHLKYYDDCSGWTWGWLGYCYAWFDVPVTYGTCFDLSDCPGECRHLEDVWYACQRVGHWPGQIDIEVYCADEANCPVGPPLAGIYGYQPFWQVWQHFDFGGLALCECEQTAAGKFIVMVTDYLAGLETAPLSDRNVKNVEEGCETEWRCSGHSYIYRNLVSYCDVYGAPGPLWFPGPGYGCTQDPNVPPDCDDWHDTGVYCEWLIDCYVSCQGPTQTEKTSWSAVKALYR